MKRIYETRQFQMLKLKCQINDKCQTSNLGSLISGVRTFDFEIWISFDICLPAAGRDFDI
jgi:hypothetical protein